MYVYLWHSAKICTAHVICRWLQSVDLNDASNFSARKLDRCASVVATLQRCSKKSSPTEDEKVSTGADSIVRVCVDSKPCMCVAAWLVRQKTKSSGGSLLVCAVNRYPKCCRACNNVAGETSDVLGSVASGMTAEPHRSLCRTLHRRVVDARPHRCLVEHDSFDHMREPETCMPLPLPHNAFCELSTECSARHPPENIKLF